MSGTLTFMSDPAATTVAFIRRSGPALGFGFLLAFSSSVGQTYFIGLFGTGLRADLGLSHGAFGTLYSMATLASAAILLYAGKLVDHVSTRTAVLLTLGLLTAATLAMAFASSIAMLWIALFGLRLGGQGMLGHIALTATARWFSAERGRALGLVTLGFPAGEAILPPLVALGLAAADARTLWLLAALLLVAVVGPLAAFLSAYVHRQTAEEEPTHRATDRPAPLSWTRAQVIRDPRFYGIVPGLLASPFIITGLLFHQGRLVEVNGWTLTGFAALFPLYAVCSVVSSLALGAFSDAAGTRRALPFLLLPLGLALVLLSLSQSLAVAGLSMALIGITAGGATVLFSTLWIELYGPAHLGAIRALTSALMVFSAALGPGLMGALIDAGIGLNSQFQGLAFFVAVCAAVFAYLQPLLVAKAPPGAFMQ